MHIDKEGVFDPQQYYKNAGITHNDIENIIEGLWCLMQKLHIEVFGSEIEHDNYSGEDIKYLAELRDKDLHNNSPNEDWTYPGIIDTSYLIIRHEVGHEKRETYIL